MSNFQNNYYFRQIGKSLLIKQSEIFDLESILCVVIKILNKTFIRLLYFIHEFGPTGYRLTRINIFV